MLENINTGKSLIKSYLKEIPNENGIYKMIDSKNTIIYIGKAKNLKNRLSSYTQNNLSPRINHMVSSVTQLKWEITKNETDALLLESKLIKEFQPFYNILLKDDKSYPFLKIDLNHPFPGLTKFRSKSKNVEKNTFGPFASVTSLNENINIIEKIFKIRSCSDYKFNNMKQPCILYQIKRCSAPCVEKISKKEYSQTIKEVIKFLSGETFNLKQEFAKQMELAANNNDFETAITYRDKIVSLNQISIKQNIMLNENLNADFLCLIQDNNRYMFKSLSFRKGHNYGSNSFFPSVPLDNNTVNILEKMIMQFYEERIPPSTIYINIKLNDLEDKSSVKIIGETLSKVHNKKIKISYPQKQQYQEIIENITINMLEELKQQNLNDIKWQDYFNRLADFLNLNKKIHKIEVYDNSHLYGLFAKGGMICAKASGFDKSEYRIFNLKNYAHPNNSKDDYLILKETLMRRFNPNKKNLTDPELVIIDGGKGQLSVAKEVKKELNLNHITFIAIAKGKNRRAYEETIIKEDMSTLKPNKIDTILHFLQRLRNEAHRFVINNVRKNKQASLSTSELDTIPLVGAKRKKDLLAYFGSLEAIKKASLNELENVKGINIKIAEQIYNYFH